MEQNSEGWMQRKRRSIIIAVIFLIIGGIISSISLGIVLCRRKDKDDICNTPICKAVSKRILSQIDPLVNPCDDFYEFACGRFLKEVNVPEVQRGIAHVNSAMDVVRSRVRKLLIEPIMPKETILLTSIKRQHEICMNEQTDFEEAKKIIEESGGWPVLMGNSWEEERFDWKQTIYNFSRLGFHAGNYLLDIRIAFDVDNSKKLFKPPIYKDKLVHLPEKIYRDYVVNVAVMFGANRTEAEKELLDSVKFEINLLNVAKSRKNNTIRRQNLLSEFSMSKRKSYPSMVIYHGTTIAQLELDYPFIPWLEYLNRLFGEYISIGKNDQLEVDFDYLNNLKKMMRTTPKRVLANYLYWKTVSLTMQYLTNQLAEAEDQFINSARGYIGNVKSTRTNRCLTLLYERLPMVINILYIRKDLVDNKDRVERLFFNIRRELVRTFRDNNWMDARTKTDSTEKLRRMQCLVSYSDEILNDTILNEYFGDMPFNKRSFLRTTLNINLWRLTKLSEPVPEWLRRIAVLDIGGRQAVYMFRSNTIGLSPFMPHEPFDDKDYPLYLNYGGLGSIIGHEISHAFDINGRRFDKDGIFRNLFTIESERTYLGKVDCLIGQYENFTAIEDGIDTKLDSKRTIPDKIADNIGIKITYSAYDTQIKAIGQEPKLPNLKYTGRQLFWISNANMFCIKYSQQTLQDLLESDYHAPPRYRRWGMYSNMNEFARDFHCPVGTRMNPVNKCELW